MSTLPSHDLDETTQADHHQANLELIVWLRAAVTAEEAAPPTLEMRPDSPTGRIPSHGRQEA